MTADPRLSAETIAPLAQERDDWKRSCEASNAHVGELEAENARLTQRLDTLKKLGELKLVEAGADGNDFIITSASELWPLIVNALAVWFVENGGKNFIEMTADYDQPTNDAPVQSAKIRCNGPRPVGPFVVTMQRMLGKSPNTMRLEAQAALAALQGQVQAVRERLGLLISQYEWSVKSPLDAVSELRDVLSLLQADGPAPREQ